MTVSTPMGPAGPAGPTGPTGPPGTAAATGGTALPGSPTDGQLFSLIVDDTNGVEWLFRYRSSTNTWRFVGGSPLFKQNLNTITTTSTTFTTSVTGTGGAPSITLPNVGTSIDIDVEFGASEFTGTVALNTAVFVSGAIVQNATAWFFANAAGSKGTVMSRLRSPTALAGAAVTQAFATASGTASFANAFISVTPVQIHP